jgi:C1A family cysteine protease
LFIYYNERAVEGDIGQDAGASLVDGIVSIGKQGLPNETLWPYSENFAAKPTPNVYANGLQHIVGNYSQINNTRVDDMRSCLFAGFPFVLGLNVYPSFFGGTSQSTGIIPVPQAGEVRTEGHAVCAVGYNDVNQWLICRNSWGTGWGAKGYMFLPYSYATNLNWAMEFFTVRTITAY